MNLRTGIILTLSTILTTSSVASGQTILNVERHQPTDLEGFHGAIQARGALAEGNTEVADIEASGTLGYRPGRHWIRLLGGGRLLTEGGAEIVDERFGHLRHSYILSSRLRTFSFVQAQASRNLLLTDRWLLGGGLRLRIFGDEDDDLAVGTGVMWEDERLDPDRLGPADEARSRVVRAANLAVYSRELRDGVRVLNVLYFQPELTTPGDFRLLNDLAVLVQLSGALELDITAEWRHDSRPPSVLEKDDLSVNAGIGVSFR